MPRRDYEHTIVTCHKGINQQIENADPTEECADALNVWAPNGRVVQRPGYEGLTQLYSGASVTAIVFSARAEDVSSGTPFSSPVAGVLTLDGLIAQQNGPLVNNDRWYIGHTTTFGAFSTVSNNANSNTTRIKAEYWNGTAWTFLNVTEINSTDGVQERVSHLSTGATSASFFMFAPPQDWAETSVDSLSRYWLRFNLLDADLDGSTDVIVNDINDGTLPTADIRGLFVASFPSTKRYLTVVNTASTGTVTHGNLSDLLANVGSIYNTTPGAQAEPADCAVVVGTGEAFVTYGGVIVRHKEVPEITTITNDIIAEVEGGDFAVGPGAPYDRTLVVQESSFPRAKYIQFFKNRLWVANLEGAPSDVQWSAPMPYHKVWPSGSREPLVENDNSPITGLRGFHEHMTVFKGDSIFIMPSLGLNEFDLEEFDTVRVVAGTGCVSNGSIREIRNQLIFQAEDGIYAFNGVSVKKLSDRIQNYIDRITPGRRPFSAAAHWRTKSVYLLAVSLDGSDANSHVLVWDYKNDAWWVWDNVEAQHWLEDEGSYDEEKIYFGDSSGRIYEMGVGRTDHGGAIDSHVLTHRLGYGERDKKQTREVRVFADSQFTTAALSLFANDAVTAQQTQSLDFTDPYETANSRPRVRRHRRADVRVDGDWLQVKLANATKNTELVMSHLDVGQLRKGRR